MKIIGCMETCGRSSQCIIYHLITSKQAKGRAYLPSAPYFAAKPVVLNFPISPTHRKPLKLPDHLYHDLLPISLHLLHVYPFVEYIIKNSPQLRADFHFLHKSSHQRPFSFKWFHRATSKIWSSLFLKPKIIHLLWSKSSILQIKVVFIIGIGIGNM